MSIATFSYLYYASRNTTADAYDTLLSFHPIAALLCSYLVNSTRVLSNPPLLRNVCSSTPMGCRPQMVFRDA